MKKVLLCSLIASLLFAVPSYAKPAAGCQEESILIAHMGLNADAPMNTVAAFREAAEAGCTGIETDIRMTSDGEVVCFHDTKLDQATNGSGSIKNVKYEDLETVRYNKANGLKKYNDEKIPLFEEYLDVCMRSGCTAIIDIKWVANYKEMLDAVYESLQEKNMLKNAVFQCDCIEFLEYINAKDENTRKWFLLNTDITENDIRTAKKANCEAINTNHADSSSIQMAHDNGLQVCFYTINGQQKMMQYADYGCDYIMTDGYDPDMFS